MYRFLCEYTQYNTSMRPIMNCMEQNWFLLVMLMVSAMQAVILVSSGALQSVILVQLTGRVSVYLCLWWDRHKSFLSLPLSLSIVLVC